MENLGYEILHGISLILLFMFIILVSKLANDFLTPYRVDEELSEKDNVALAVSISGYLGATALVFAGALLGPTKGVLMDLLIVGGYSLFGIALLNVSRFFNDKVILSRFSNVKEIIKDRNAGTGAVQFGSYIASGMIVAGAIHGQGGGILTAVAFFALGQLGLFIFSLVYNMITSYDIHEEIEKDNVAAGVSFGGMLIAVGIILMKGASGNFISWKHNLYVFALDALIIIIFLPMVRFFFDKIIIPKTRLDHEIRNDQNLGAAFLESILAISFSTILYFAMG